MNPRRRRHNRIRRMLRKHPERSAVLRAKKPKADPDAVYYRAVAEAVGRRGE